MKILFLQNKGKSYGGVWQVNKLVGENLIKDGYTVRIVSIRENHTDFIPDYNPRMVVETINTVDDWETYSYSEIFKSFKGLSKLKSRLNYNKTIKKDIKKLHTYIYNYEPDYIVTSQYQLLDMIPKSYLSKTFHEQHLTFKDSWAHKATRKTLIKYKDKVKYIWLCENSKNEAIKHGLINSISIYNAVRFKSNNIANVTQNKKIVTIARLSNQKRIDKMVNILEKVFESDKYNNWVFEIYGDGSQKEYIESLIKSKQIKLMGRTDDPKGVLLGSSINLNTSDYEGFPLGILEAGECGIPTVSFDFGESTIETIINNKTGFIVNNEEEYIYKLKELMDNPSLLKELSKNAKEYNKKFQIENIIKKWEEILK